MGELIYSILEQSINVKSMRGYRSILHMAQCSRFKGETRKICFTFRIIIKKKKNFYLYFCANRRHFDPVPCRHGFFDVVVVHCVYYSLIRNFFFFFFDKIYAYFFLCASGFFVQYNIYINIRTITIPNVVLSFEKYEMTEKIRKKPLNKTKNNWKRFSNSAPRSPGAEIWIWNKSKYDNIKFIVEHSNVIAGRVCYTTWKR